MRSPLRATVLAFSVCMTGADAGSKTTTPVKIDPAEIGENPYRVNGLVISGDSRGSGFCAGHPKTFFTAAHVVYSESAGWNEPPGWVLRANAATLDPTDLVASRGYYRFDRYSELVETKGESGAFGRDVALAFGFKNFIDGRPARLSQTGSEDLRSNKRKLITGYPAVKDYTGGDTNGFFLHSTGPFRDVFRPASRGSVATTLVSTGPGNSGGPVWTAKQPGAPWVVSGILVGGLPSESEVYTIAPETFILQDLARKVVARKPAIPIPVEGVSASSLFFPYNDSQTLPDGTSRWSRFSVGVFGFGEFSKLTSVRVSLEIKTPHRGDLQVVLVAPGGIATVLHNEQGADRNNLVITDLDVTEAFTDINPKGRWTLRVRDRLKGDIALFKGFRLEIAATPVEEDSGTETSS
jgi:subtilisin-like proprotein convertase family protein/V8-like Glu-specific endopeptidase